jgi:Protein of unknown function (DUF1579)
MRRLTQVLWMTSGLALAVDGRADAANALPTPAPALVDAFRGMTGTWNCDGKFQKMDGSGTLDSKSTMVLTAAVGGFGYSGDVTVAATAQMPNGMKEQMFWSYNSATKKLVEFFVDSFGTLGHGTSDGRTVDTIVWDEDVVMMGKAAKFRTTVKSTGANALVLTFDTQTDGKWATLGTNTCTKT